jgi:hypothetical protein
VRERGFEPLSAEAGWILSPVRLPVPPLSLHDYIFIRSWIVNGNYFMHFSGHVALFFSYNLLGALTDILIQYHSFLLAEKMKSC